MSLHKNTKSIAVNTRLLLSGRLEGMGIHMLEILKRITSRNPDILFHFIFDRAWDPVYHWADHIQCHHIFPPTRHPVLIRYWFDHALTRLLKKLKPDVFWSPDNFTSLRTQIPTVLTVHDLAYLHIAGGVSASMQKHYERYMPSYVKKADHILAVSTSTKDDIIKHYHYPADKIDICYNGCREAFKPLMPNEKTAAQNKFAQGKPYIAYLGSLHPRKNVHRMVMAFDAFKKQTRADIKLVIAGRRAWMTNDLDQALKNANHKKDIILLDKYMDVQEAVQFVGGAFTLCYISLFEGFGIPILEGLNCHIPVITSQISSMPEVGGDAVVYVDPYQVNCIAGAMVKLYHDDAYRSELIQKTQTQKLKFSWDQTARITEKVLKNYI